MEGISLKNGLVIRCPKSDQHKITIVDENEASGNTYCLRNYNLECECGNTCEVSEDWTLR